MADQQSCRQAPRGQTPYQQAMSEMMSVIRRRNPGMSQRDVMRAAAQVYRSTPATVENGQMVRRIDRLDAAGQPFGSVITVYTKLPRAPSAADASASTLAGCRRF